MAPEATEGPGAEPEAAYYQGIEEHFVSRRGDPLFLSNADWTLIHGWRQAGIPLRIVLRGINDAFDSHAHSWGRHRKVRSLRYCAPEVDAAIERWRQALQGGAEGGTAGFLERLADALRRAQALGPHARTEVDELRATLEGEGGRARDPERLEAWLRAAEERLLAAVTAETPPDALDEITREIEADLAPYRDRMPAKVLNQVRAESRTRRLLERHGLPRLSLFQS